jgi:chloride channel protein, CIC family
VRRAFERATPVDLQLLGKILLHAALVGVAAGIVGTFFVFGSELVAAILLGQLAGYKQLSAGGEHNLFPFLERIPKFRPAVFVFIPPLGGLLSGVLCARYAPEALGGGTDVVIDAFHNRAGLLRKRILGIKLVASIATLGTGGAGGREGPTMLMGGIIGSMVGRMLRAGERERRLLLVAGTAAGMAAVFHTPLGAALLAVEILHRDDFESDALVPAVLASVVGYSTSLALLDHKPLFVHGSYPFVPAHLPLYALLAIVVSLAAMGFVKLMDGVKKLVKNSLLPAWSKPMIGGFALSAIVTPTLLLLAPYIGQGQGLGLLGGGYGAAQVAISGASWLPEQWSGVQLMLVFALAKMVASSITVGSGGSAGDFGPSLVIGGLVGGAFGRACSLIFNDPRIDAGAFALVGMGTFYGGIAHVPLAALVMVCELAGSYDLLVPLMLAGGIAFVVLRKHALYKNQVPTKKQSPAHRKDMILDVLGEICVRDVWTSKPFATLTRGTSLLEALRFVTEFNEQDTFPVLADSGELLGVVQADVILRAHARKDAEIRGAEESTHDVLEHFMEEPFSIRLGTNLHKALELILAHHARELPVLDDDDRVIGLLDEAEITLAYQDATDGAALFSTHV